MAATSVRSDISLVRVILAFLAMYLIWGSTYLAIRWGIESIPPFMMIGSRFMIGGLLLYWFARVRGAPRPSRREWRAAAIPGTLMLAGGTGLVAFGPDRPPGSHRAALDSDPRLGPAERLPPGYRHYRRTRAWFCRGRSAVEPGLQRQ